MHFPQILFKDPACIRDYCPWDPGEPACRRAQAVSVQAKETPCKACNTPTPGEAALDPSSTGRRPVCPEKGGGAELGAAQGQETQCARLIAAVLLFRQGGWTGSKMNWAWPVQRCILILQNTRRPCKMCLRIYEAHRPSYEIFFFLEDLFACLLIWRDRQRHREAELSSPTVKMCAAVEAGPCQSQDTRTPTGSPMWETGAHVTGPSAAAVPSTSAGSSTLMGWRRCSWWFSPQCHNASPRTKI